MTSPPTQPLPPRDLADPDCRRSTGWRVLIACAWAFLTVYYHAPVREVVDASLDSSNYASYAYFTAHGFQYGPEVVPMAGPLGFVMYGFVYGGELFWARVIGQFLLTGALAALTLWFFLRHRNSGWRWVWLVAHLGYTPFIEDLPVEWALLLGGLLLLQNGPARPGRAAVLLTSALLAGASLIKGTHLILALATVIVVAAGLAAQRDWRRAGLVLASYAVALLGAWILLGQHPAHLPAFLDGVRQLASGYNAAMSLDAPSAVLRRGLVIVGLLGLGLGWAAWIHRRHPAILAGLVLFAGFTFANWKHGFVRADGHAYMFFHYAVVAALAVYLHAFRPPIWPDEDPPSRKMRRGGLALMLVTIAAAVYGPNEPMRPQILALSRQIGARTLHHVNHLCRLPQIRASLEAQLEARRELMTLPLTRKRVGDASVDFFGFEHAVIPLNRLDYRPRPMGGGSFNAYNRALLELNRAYLADPATRPAFFLLKMQTIDDRFMAQDDGLALLELLHHYRPVLVEKGYVLLQADRRDRTPPLRPIGRETFRFGDHVPVPAVDDDELLLARFELPSSLTGRLLAAVYKPPRVLIQLFGDRIEHPAHRRIVPTMTSTPFLLAPVLENTGDFLNLYTRRTPKPLRSFRLSSTDRTGFAQELAVEFYAMPRPRMLPEPEIDDFLSFTRASVATVDAESITTDEGVAEPARALQTQLLHPPGEMRWKLDGTEASVTFGYGLVAGAYTDGHTDGVTFIAELQLPQQPAAEVYRRHLDPVRYPADRGHHLAHLRLPSVPPGTRFVVRTEEGPHENSAWDWAYVGHFDFDAESPAAARTRGSPEGMVLDGSGPLPAEMVDGQPATLLHAPGEVRLDPPAGAEWLSFDFGFASAAFSDPAATDGAGFTAEILHPDGSRDVFFRRTLRPRTDPRDQGVQRARLPLPILKPGAHVVLRTDPGPGGNNAWDWTYVARISFE